MMDRWIDDIDDYWKSIIWHRIKQDRRTWKQHAEAFAQLRVHRQHNDDDSDGTVEMESIHT